MLCANIKLVFSLSRKFQEIASNVDARAVLDFAHDVDLVLVVSGAVTLLQGAVELLQRANVSSRDCTCNSVRCHHFV